MESGNTEFEASDTTIATLEAIIETACAPIFADIQMLIGTEITSKKIIQFAEEHEVRGDAVQLATHICEVLLKNILAAQNDIVYIHTTQGVREEVERIMDRNAVHLKCITRTYTKYDIPINLRKDLLALAQNFLEQL